MKDWSNDQYLSHESDAIATNSPKSNTMVI
jgi:hypothetical protein